MPKIRHLASNFPAGILTDGSHECICSWADVVWAAITVGKRELYDVDRHGQFSLFEIVARTATLFASLKENDDGYLIRSDVYDGLDPTEKGATSYLLGLVMAKLMSQIYLGVPWLMHLDVYRDRVEARLSGRSRPDLIGQNVANEWVVVEAKGRTGPRDAGALAQAKNQAGEIVSIGGDHPILRVGLMAHFTKGWLEVDWEDPEREESQEEVRVDLRGSELKEGYYRPFERLFTTLRDRTTTEMIGDQEFRIVPVETADLEVGRAVAHSRHVGLEYQRFWQGIHREGRVAVGGDGILVRLGRSWSEENMRLEPQSRDSLME